MASIRAGEGGDTFTGGEGGASQQPPPSLSPPVLQDFLKTVNNEEEEKIKTNRFPFAFPILTSMGSSLKHFLIGIFSTHIYIYI